MEFHTIMVTFYDKPTELKIKKTGFLHFPQSGKRELVDCVVIEQTPESEEFFRNGVGTPARLKIVLLKENPEDHDKVDAYFRNLNNEETLNLIFKRHLEAEYLDTLFGSYIPEDFNPVTIPDENKEDLENALKTQYLLNNIENIPEINSETLYKITLTLEEADLIEKFSSPESWEDTSTALVTDRFYQTMKRKPFKNRVPAKSLVSLHLPEPDTHEYYSVVSYITHKLTGVFPFHLSKSNSNHARGELLSLIVNIANGSQKAMVEVFKYLNKINKANTVITRRANGDFTVTPTPEDIELTFIAETVDRAYRFLTLENILPLLVDNEQAGYDYLDTSKEINQMFKEAGLDDSLQEIWKEDNWNIKNVEDTNPVPNNNSDIDEIAAYFNKEITPTTFPSPMDSLVKIINYPLLYDYDWAGGDLSNLPDNITLSAVTVAKILTLAVRYGRLLNLTLAASVPIGTTAILVLSLTNPEERTFWVPEEIIRILITGGDEGKNTFVQVMSSGMKHPDMNQESLSPEMLLNSLLTHMMHRAGHMILDQGLTEDEVYNQGVDYVELIPFFTALFHEDTVPELNPPMCLPLKASVYGLSQLDFTVSGENLVSEVGDLILQLGENFVKEQNPDIDLRDKSSKELVEEYLVNQLIYNGFNV